MTEPSQPFVPAEQRDFRLREEQAIKPRERVESVRCHQPAHVIDMPVREGHGPDVLPGHSRFAEGAKEKVHRQQPCIRGAGVDQDVAARLDDQEGVDGQPHLFGQFRPERAVTLLAQLARRHVYVAIAECHNDQLTDFVAYEVGSRLDPPHRKASKRADVARHAGLLIMGHAFR